FLIRHGATIANPRTDRHGLDLLQRGSGFGPRAKIKLTIWRNTMKMHTLTRSASAAAALAVVAVVGGGMERAHAAEIQVLSAAAMQSIFKVIGSEFEHQSGDKLVMTYATMGAITDRVLAG